MGAAPRLRDRIEWRLGLAFWIVLTTTCAVGGAGGALLPFALPVALFLAAWPWLRRTRAAPGLADWLPFPLVIVTYEALHRTVPMLWEPTIDAWLRSVDHAVLGADAAAHVSAIVSEPVTTLMAAAYASYYVAPLSLAIVWWRKNRTAFRELMAGEVGALFIGYLGYLFLPAIGPHAFLGADALGGPLPGDFIGEWIRSLNEAHDGQFPRDAFPSLHTANAVTMVLVLLRHERRLLAVYLLPLAGLVAATVYLRFHYVVDVVAGAALAVAWQQAVPALVARERRAVPPATIAPPREQPPAHARQT